MLVFKTVLNINGMACGMCEAHINDVIRKTVPDSKKVKASFKKGECTFISAEAPDEERLKAAIGETGYELVSVSSEAVEKKARKWFPF